MNDKPVPMRRGRRPMSVLKSAMEQANIDPATVEIEAAPAPRDDMRVAMRPAMREEDPRVRAAKRAAEIRGNIGSLDEGDDKYYIDPRDVPPGWSYEWKRKSVLGQEDPAYQISLARKGWDPVPAERMPHMMPTGGKHTTIERDGQILMERPLELTEEAKDIEKRKARQQMRMKEQQLNEAPQGQFDRGDPRVAAKIKRSYEPIPVPPDA